MRDDQQKTRRRTDEAADWFTRMSRTRISNDTLDGFWAWRRDPRNRAAYEAVEDLAGMARTLRHDPDIRAAAREAIIRRPWWRSALESVRLRPALLYGGGLAATALAAGVLIVAVGQAETYSTGVGQQTTIKLSDGSSVRLDTDSRVRVRFGKGQRRLVLEKGQAFFTVAHDTARPFLVDAGRAQVRAVGTQFDVRRSPMSVDVTLTQGRVQVTSSGTRAAGWTLDPGQQIHIDSHGTAAAPAPADLKAATAWTTGRLLFHDTPLAQAVAEINRYNRRKIALATGTPATVRVNGAFGTGDVDGFVAAASDSLSLAVDHRPDGTVELRPPAASPE